MPIILVGTKHDLLANNADHKIPSVTFYQGIEMKREIGAMRYLECSAWTLWGVADIFEVAVKISLQRMKKKKKKSCIML